MKIDPNEPAFPVQESMISGSTGEVPAARGLTIRAHFAAMALSEKEINMIVDAYFLAYPDETTVSIGRLRCFHADRLIAELNKERP